MSSEDECLSPLMSIRPSKSTAILRTPLLSRLDKPPPTNVTPLNTISEHRLDFFKTPDTASSKKVTAAFLFSSCKKNTETNATPRHTVLVGDSSDDEEQFQDSFKHLTSERGSSYAVEDSITEFSLIRKWLINAEESDSSSDSEPEQPEDCLSHLLQNKPSEKNHLTFTMNQNDESIILLSSSEDEGTSLESKCSDAKSRIKNLCISPTTPKENGDSSELCESSFSASPPIRTLHEKLKQNKQYLNLADTLCSEDEVSTTSILKLREVSTMELSRTPDQDTNKSSKQISKSHITPESRIPGSSPKSHRLASLESTLNIFSCRGKSSNSLTKFATFQSSGNTSQFAKPAVQDDIFVESSDEENLLPLSSKLSTFLNQQQIGLSNRNSQNTSFSSEKISTTKMPSQLKLREEVESDLEDIFSNLSLTEIPISKPKKTPKPRRKKTQIIDSDDDASNTKRSGKATFLSSLSADIPHESRHPEAKPFMKAFKKNKDELTRRLFHIFNEAVFDNQLQRDFSITWNNRLTRTAGYCRHFTRRENGVTFFESRIELSAKVVDTPCRLRDTLVHELCHAATWTIDNCRGGHGPVWRKWANKALRAFPELPPITRCHNYEITYKYYYNCVVCSFSTGRHSKSVDTATHVCPMCRGRLELSKEPNKAAASSDRSDEVVAITPTAPKTPRTPNAFALFVKDNYAAVKASRSGMPHAGVMKVLSAKFAESKKQSNVL